MRRYLTRFATIFLSCDQVLYNLSSLILNLAFTKHKNYYQIKANGNPSTSRPYLGIPLLFWSKFSFPLSLSLSEFSFFLFIYAHPHFLYEVLLYSFVINHCISKQYQHYTFSCSLYTRTTRRLCQKYSIGPPNT